MSKDVPSHWGKSSWEEKARENPLHAIMTIEAFRDKSADDLRNGAPEEFLQKGQIIFKRMIDPYLTAKEQKLVMFDYGCGAGRIMNAVVEAGHEAIGADISPTIVEACRRIVPAAKAVTVVSAEGDVALDDRSCDVAYSFAVVQHIQSLTVYEKAVAEMTRVVRPGGLVSIQANCEDLACGPGVPPGYTINFEGFSVHFRNPEDGPVRVHPQNNWSGVYIGIDRFIRLLNSNGCHLIDYFNWRETKLRSTVFVARKCEGVNKFQPRRDPFKQVSAGMYRALLKKYGVVSVERKRLKEMLDARDKGAVNTDAGE